MKKFFRVILLSIGGALMLDTLLLLILTSARSLGIYMPFGIGFPLFSIGIFLEPLGHFFTSSKLGKAIRIFIIAAYAIISVILVSASTIIFFAGHSEPEANADVLIVLGCGINGTKPSATLEKRLLRAVEYLNQSPNTFVIVSGGKGADEGQSEASVMREYLINSGIASSRIFLEDKSTSTTENFLFSKEILDTHLPDAARIAFITTHFHVFRAERVAKKCGISADGIGAAGVTYITFNDYLRESIAIFIYGISGKL